MKSRAGLSQYVVQVLFSLYQLYYISKASIRYSTWVDGCLGGTPSYPRTQHATQSLPHGVTTHAGVATYDDDSTGMR